MSEPILTVPAAEVQRNFGLYQDKALRQPISVTRNGRARVVMISVEEYQRLKRRDRLAMKVEDLPDEWLKAIEKAEPPIDAAQFDGEV
ncbi:MAG: type II toxin-antitoxin system Phd/YefM family antitoxin [Sphingomonadales bacterium]|nr:type II toxin-antitoxin system Phd/YefM family antitoxin [Sphingomonadales bacterium]